MLKQLNPVASEILRNQLTKFDMDVRCSVEAQRIYQTADGMCIEADDGSALEVDVVIMAAGIRPRDELMHGAELSMSPGGGVVVDDHLRTSDKNIFAIGECCRHRGIVYGLAGPGARYGEGFS